MNLGHFLVNLIDIFEGYGLLLTIVVSKMCTFLFLIYQLNRNALDTWYITSTKKNACVDLYFKVKEKSNTLTNYRSNHKYIDW